MKRFQYRGTKGIFGLLLLLCVNIAFAQNIGNWTWSVNTFGPPDPVTLDGHAESFSAAETALKNACSYCNMATMVSSYINTYTSSYGYDIEPVDLPADYTEWESHLDEYLSSNEEAWANAGLSPCQAPEAFPVGDWYASSIYLDPSLTEYIDVDITTYHDPDTGSSCIAETAHLGHAFRTRQPDCEPGRGAVLVNIPNTDPPVSRHMCRESYSGGINGPRVKPDSCNQTGNPCSVSTGDKLKTQTDISINGLSFLRYYSSMQSISTGAIGQAWRHNYGDRLLMSGSAGSAPSQYISQQGRQLTLVPAGTDQYLFKDGENYKPDAQTLIKVAGDWQISFVSGAKRTYGADGQLIKIESAAGKTTTLDYLTSRLNTVTDHYGKSLTFSYADNRISQIAQPDGATIGYLYDSVGNLVSIRYPDATPLTEVDNPSLLLHYEDTRFVHHLTGITDENGQRHQTYQYDQSGKVVQSEKASTSNAIGQERIGLAY